MGGTFSTEHLSHLLASYGYLAIFLAIIADSFGLPIPGEVMVLLASVYAGATHHLQLPLVTGGAAAGAILGDNVTFQLGRTGGRRFLVRYGSRLHMDRRRLHLGRFLFGTYGGRVVLVGRFIPVLHIWTAILAGANAMPWRRFVLFNAAGAVLWACCLTLAGFAFGSAAVRLGGAIADAALPMALVIAGGTVLILRLNEQRLHEVAGRAMARRRQRSG